MRYAKLKKKNVTFSQDVCFFLTFFVLNSIRREKERISKKESAYFFLRGVYFYLSLFWYGRTL
jgi:hypothetical protein